MNTKSAIRGARAAADIKEAAKTAANSRSTQASKQASAHAADVRCNMANGKNMIIGAGQDTARRAPKKEYPPVLDACCGGRMMWYNKNDKRALCVDIRREVYTDLDKRSNTVFQIEPDEIADFRSLPYPSNTFSLVVFDPPHCTRNGKNSRTSKKYGGLTGMWREMLRAGFAECFRN